MLDIWTTSLMSSNRYNKRLISHNFISNQNVSSFFAADEVLLNLKNTRKDLFLGRRFLNDLL